MALRSKKSRKVEPSKKRGKSIRAAPKARSVLRSPSGTKTARGFAPTRLRLRRPVPSDIEIAQEAMLKPILQIAEELGIRQDELELYGPYKAKVKLEILERLKNRPNGKYVDVTAGTALYEEWKRRDKLSDDVWLERVEDILYFEIDSRMDAEMILSYGKKLREAFYRNLPGFVKGIELIGREDMYEFHADFLSRLATFTHGDYSAIDAIPEKEGTAQWLFERSLKYYPNERAYLGLGIIYQKRRQYEESLRILSAGAKHFPGNEQIALCSV